MPTKYSIGSLDHILSEIPDGRELALIWTRALAITGDEQSRKFMEAYDNRDRESQPLEDFLPKGMDGADFLANFVRVATRYSNLKIDLLKLTNLPTVYEKSLKVAQTPKGFDDRTAILKQENLHHAAKANQININQQTLNAGQLPDMASFTRTLEQLENEPRQLPAATREFVEGSVIEEGVKVER